MNDTSDAQAIINEFREFAKLQLFEVPHPDDPTKAIKIGFNPGAEHAEPIDLTKLVDSHRRAPETLFGTAVLTDLDSFIAHVRAFSRTEQVDEKPESVLFGDASRAAPKLTAIYDYQTTERPSFARHRAVYAFQLSDEWRAWTGVAGRSMGQADLAAFLEGHLEDVVATESIGEQTRLLLSSLALKAEGPARILEVAGGLSLTVSQKVAQKINTQTGARELQFTEEHRDAGGMTKLEVPGAFVVAIPVFQLGALFQLPVRLQYRITDGAVRWTLSPLRTEATFDAAFREACERAKESTSLPLFYGRDEKA